MAENGKGWRIGQGAPKTSHHAVSEVEHVDFFGGEGGEEETGASDGTAQEGGCLEADDVGEDAGDHADQEGGAHG